MDATIILQRRKLCQTTDFILRGTLRDCPPGDQHKSYKLFSFSLLMCCVDGVFGDLIGAGRIGSVLGFGFVVDVVARSSGVGAGSCGDCWSFRLFVESYRGRSSSVGVGFGRGRSSGIGVDSAEVGVAMSVLGSAAGG
jgi:hypothetical protein